MHNKALRLLVISCDDLPSTARLVAPAAEAGFEVAALSPSGGLVQTAHRLAARFPLLYDDLRRGDLASTYNALLSFTPDFLVAGDTLSARLLNFLAHSPSSRLPPNLHAVARRSASSQMGARLAGSRWRIQELARALGIACAPSASVTRLNQAEAFANLHGWPVYLKADYTYSGAGVRYCETRAQLEAAFDEFASRHRGRGMLRRGRQLLFSMRGRSLPLAAPSQGAGLMIEAAAPGEPTYYVAVALEGRWLAGYAVEVEDFHPKPVGPSSRIRIHHDPELADAARRLIRRLGHSGLCGLDFIRQPKGPLNFIEFNERTTQATHLGGLVNCNLLAALYDALEGRAPASPNPIGEARIALFPKEWERDPRTSARSDLHFDIPWDEPELLEMLSAELPPDWTPPARPRGR